MKKEGAYEDLMNEVEDDEDVTNEKRRINDTSLPHLVESNRLIVKNISKVITNLHTCFFLCCYLNQLSLKC